MSWLALCLISLARGEAGVCGWCRKSLLGLRPLGQFVWRQKTEIQKTPIEPGFRYEATGEQEGVVCFSKLCAGCWRKVEVLHYLIISTSVSSSVYLPRGPGDGGQYDSY
jgi:hypothetical protein